MKLDAYVSKYLFRGQRSCLYNLDRNRHLISSDGLVSGQAVLVVPTPPPSSKVLQMKILKIDITKKKIVYALVGSVICNFVDGQAPVWFEIAISCSREQLEIWKDLHYAEDKPQI